MSSRPDEATLRDLYEVQRLTTRQIGKQYKVTGTSVKRWLKFYSIQARAAHNGLLNRGIIPPTADELNRMVHIERLSYREVAEKFGVDQSAIPHWLDKHGIPRAEVWTIDAEELRDLYESGLTTGDIGRRRGVSSTSIKEAMERYGIKARPSGFNGGIRYQCSNGLEVRSAYERRVGDWLLAHTVPFVYEPTLPFNRRLTADFLANEWYIEIWGVEGWAVYEERREKKQRLYRLHSLPLIEFRPYEIYREIFNRRLSTCLRLPDDDLPLCRTR